MDKEHKKNWIQEIREKDDKEIQEMMGNESPYSGGVSRRIDFALFELQRRVQVKNVKAVRELVDATDKIAKSTVENAKTAKTLNNRTILVGVVTLVFMLVAGIIAYFTFKTNSDQLGLSREILDTSTEQFEISKIEEENALWMAFKAVSCENFNTAGILESSRDKKIAFSNVGFETSFYYSNYPKLIRLIQKKEFSDSVFIQLIVLMNIINNDLDRSNNVITEDILSYSELLRENFAVVGITNELCSIIFPEYINH